VSERQPPVRFVCGIRGHGKTTLARQLVAPAPRVLAYDPFGEHDVLALDWGELVDYLDYVESLDTFRVGLREAGHEEEFCALALVVGRRLQQEPPARQCVVLLEEADLITRPGQEPPVFQDLVARGRHEGIELVAVTRRPAEVSRIITSQAEEFYCFRTQEPRDVTYLRSYIGEAAAEATKGLTKFNYVAWQGGEWSEQTLPGPGRVAPQPLAGAEAE
jgi:hypothetical protein